MCVYVCMCLCIYVCMCVCMCLYVCVYACMYICVYVCVYVCGVYLCPHDFGYKYKNVLLTSQGEYFMTKCVFSGLLCVTTMGDIRTMNPKDPKYACFVELNNFPNVSSTDALSCCVSGSLVCWFVLTRVLSIL